LSVLLVTDVIRDGRSEFAAGVIDRSAVANLQRERVSKKGCGAGRSRQGAPESVFPWALYWRFRNCWRLSAALATARASESLAM
jgi:hypothetical protein